MTEETRMAGAPFKVIIFSSVPPRQVARIAERIRREVPQATVAGVLYERRPPKTGKQRIENWRRKMRRPIYWSYVAYRLNAWLKNRLYGLLDFAIRSIHAAPRWPNGKPGFGLDDLGAACRKLEAELFVTPDIHSEEALAFVRRLNADLGLVFGTRILKPALYTIPKQGSINIHKRKVPDYRGGGAVGLWELLDDQKEIGITVHRVEPKVDVGGVLRCTTIPIEPYDDLESLALKADIIGGDLITATIRDCAQGSVKETPQSGPGKTLRSPAAEDFLQMKRLLAERRKGYGNPYRRPPWKLLAKSLLFAVPVTIRNWRRRMRGDFPVMILYHHLVSDRPHRFGVSTAYFLRQVNYLLRHYRVVGLSEAVELIRNGNVTMPTVVITFDDGYADNFINLRAVAAECGVRVGYFVSTAYISEGREFAHDQLFQEAGFLPNSWDQVRFLRDSGFEIGSHTRNHADCGSSDPEFLRSEIVGALDDLKQKLGPTPHFSFPFGMPLNISEQAIDIACANYPNVFSAYGGGNVPGENNRVLKRVNFPFTVWELELQLQSALGPTKREGAHSVDQAS
jgi:peptidoglycan/xylan/chitin deacetylase (PgdA/CDA1 family)/folate-dependent phosphoribosylglycinamide formyltransferase PurN